MLCRDLVGECSLSVLCCRLIRDLRVALSRQLKHDLYFCGVKQDYDLPWLFRSSERCSTVDGRKWSVGLNCEYSFEISNLDKYLFR